jgi:hypothetical protein
LRKLRLILGDGKTPAGQVEFANQIGISVATLRAAEAGRRPVPAHVWMHIFLYLCARWDPQKRGWYVLDSEVPYEKEHASLAGTLDPHEPYVDDYNIHRLIERILAMFKGCPTRVHRRGLLMYLFRHLKETAEGFCLRADLRPTEPLWTETRNPNVWGKPLPKEVVFWPVYPYSTGRISPHQDPGGIFDFRSWRTFRPEDYPGGKTLDEQPEIVQKPTAEKQPAPEKKEIFNAPITHPNTEKAKSTLKERVSE